MSNLETSPDELLCPSDPGPLVAGVQILAPRLVPLGGPRAMTVRRTLPQRGRSLIGAWCFVDHYGPHHIKNNPPMAVPPHPHTGLATLSWLFSGEILHADSAGNHTLIRPGELNLMTAGRGISHSEYSTPTTHTLHGVQLWAALPDAARFTWPKFEHYRPVPRQLPGVVISVFLGSALGEHSPVETFTPMVGAEIRLDAGAALTLDLAPGFEHGFLVDTGSPSIAGTTVAKDELAYLGLGHDTVHLVAGNAPVRLLFIGGEPLNESILMWWNFVGRTHEEIVAFRAAWQAVIGQEPGGAQFTFTLPTGQRDAPLPAPALPTVRLRPRANPS
ncbi:pirin family protein [Arthrobacter psychrochitiniphilus]|uniref:pirin family protein n=1 Tax=Arthrobacter psychrochitiniphilus TaxID=291045 RepID=UPI003F7B84CD